MAERAASRVTTCYGCRLTMIVPAHPQVLRLCAACEEEADMFMRLCEEDQRPPT